MNPPDEIVEPLLKSVRDFARREINPLRVDQDHSIPPHVLAGMRELGLFGCSLPVDWGGSGLSARDVTRVIATLAEVDRSVATTVGLHLGLGTRGLVAWGSRAQQERWLPALATGEKIAAFATTEPNAGSDLSHLESMATVKPDGHLRFSGTKLYVTNGGFASLLTVTASTPGLGGSTAGTSLLLIDPATPGVHRQPEERKLGLKGSSTTGFIFDDVNLAPEAVLGEPGHGTTYLKHVLSWGRLLLSAGCVGTARAALKAALTHVHHRRQFRKTLIQQEVVQQSLAWASALSFGMASLVRSAAEAEHHWPSLARLTTSSKVFCSEGAWEIADLALQLHGGSGYIEDVGLALLLRDARVTRIFEGANEVLLTHAGLMELTEPASRPHPVAALDAVWNQVEARRQALRGDSPQLTVRCLHRHAQQYALGRAVIWRDAATAAMQYANSPEERAAADLLCEHAATIAQSTPHSPRATSVLVASLMEGQLP